MTLTKNPELQKEFCKKRLENGSKPKTITSKPFFGINLKLTCQNTSILQTMLTKLDRHCYTIDKLTPRYLNIFLGLILH